MNQLRYVIYIRKSTDTEDRQQLSLQAQRDAILKIVNQKDLTVVGKPFEESQSAKVPGRPVFEKVLKMIADGKADAILCWHLNRLARNSLDGGRIIWELGEGIIKEIRTPDSVYTGSPDDKLMMNIIFGMATKKVDDLGKDVKRGNRAALEQGRWPGRPKLGYMRDRRSRQLIPDPERFEAIKEIWRMKLLGMRTIDIYETITKKWGLRTQPWGNKGENLIKLSQLYKILRDPFYMGIMVRNKEEFKGNHEPIVSPKEFNKIQTMLSENRKSDTKPRTHNFLYSGLFRCGRCNAKVTAQYTTGKTGKKYIHYRCCAKKKGFNYCPEGSIQEASIDKAVDIFLESLTISPEVESLILREIEKIDQDKEFEREHIEAQLLSERSKIENQLAKMRDLLINGVITEDEYKQDKSLYIEKKVEINSKLRDLETESDKFLQLFDESISFLNSAKNIYKTSDNEKKRFILRILADKMTIKKKTPLILAKYPFVLSEKNLQSCRNSPEYGLVKQIKNLYEDIQLLKW